MYTKVQRLGTGAALALLLLPALHATTVPRFTFEQLTDSSEIVASGRVTHTWAAWDSEHKYIWTHYVLSVSETVKGAPASSVEFAEPGGATAEATMTIAGTVAYATGENVVVFLSRMPNGYLRTTGWSQGKYTLDAGGRLDGAPSTGVRGLSLNDLKQRVAARIRATGGRQQ